MALRVYILGASGAGVSTLGGALARALAVPAFDVDDYYWMPTDPPFRIKRPVEDRIRRLQTDLMLPSWVLSGSLDGWGDPVADLATHVVYVDTPAALRIARLRQREQARFGARIACGGDMHAHHKAFLDWDVLGANGQGLDCLFVASGIHGDLARGADGRVDVARAEALLAAEGAHARYAMLDLVW